MDNTTKADGNVNQTVARAGTDKYSETPQGGLVGLANDEYLSNARMTNDNEQLLQQLVILQRLTETQTRQQIIQQTLLQIITQQLTMSRIISRQ